MSALFELVPALARHLPWLPLGDWPSPLELAPIDGREVWLKREDLSAPHYAGNKIRPLEVVFGAARRAGKRRIWATGAFGSNHALATLIHAPRHGFDAAALLWPQPVSDTARDNLVAMLSLTRPRRGDAPGVSLRMLRTIAAFPPAALAQATLARHDWVMPPGAATPLGALGHASAAVELARQLRDRGAHDPRAIILPCGSTCTTVGLLVGTALVAHLGLSRHPPEIHAVRVTPWPVTARLRIALLARRTAALLAELGGPRLDLPLAALLDRLVVAGEQLGPGYGHPTAAGRAAAAALAACDLRLDTTYSAKAGAYLRERLPTLPDPVVFWSTKSAVPLPEVRPDRVARAPRHVRRWLARSRAE